MAKSTEIGWCFTVPSHLLPCRALAPGRTKSEARAYLKRAIGRPRERLPVGTVAVRFGPISQSIPVPRHFLMCSCKPTKPEKPRPMPPAIPPKKGKGKPKKGR